MSQSIRKERWTYIAENKIVKFKKIDKETEEETWGRARHRKIYLFAEGEVFGPSVLRIFFSMKTGFTISALKEKAKGTYWPTLQLCPEEIEEDKWVCQESKVPLERIRRILNWKLGKADAERAELAMLG